MEWNSLPDDMTEGPPSNGGWFVQIWPCFYISPPPFIFWSELNLLPSLVLLKLSWRAFKLQSPKWNIIVWHAWQKCVSKSILFEIPKLFCIWNACIFTKLERKYLKYKILVFEILLYIFPWSDKNLLRMKNKGETSKSVLSLVWINQIEWLLTPYSLYRRADILLTKFLYPAILNWIK